jgi:hypothetical protein
MQLALGSARLCSIPMLKMSFLGPYDVAEILMLIASVVVVAAILVAI